MNTFSKSLTLLLFTTVSSLLLPFTTYAQVPPPPSLHANSYILIDFRSGSVLAEKQADTPVEPASITKLMTAYVIYKLHAAGDLSFDDKTKVSTKARYMEGSRMFLEEKSTVTIDELLNGLIIQSGNDAAIALAEHAAGSEEKFVTLMNQFAHTLGMTNSSFTNATGLPHPEHTMSARDIATMLSAIIQEFPQHYARYKIKEFTYNGIKQYNRNRLLWSDESVDGGKTGHTDSAGFCLVASANREGMRLISVVLGTDTKKQRAESSQRLINYGYRFYKTYTLKQAHISLLSPKIYKGLNDTISLGTTQPIEVTIAKDSFNTLKLSSKLQTPIIAPVSKGQPLGKVIVKQDGKIITHYPLVALEDVPEGGLLKRLIDTLTLMF